VVLAEGSLFNKQFEISARVLPAIGCSKARKSRLLIKGVRINTVLYKTLGKK
jgi:hypothetical protein